MDVSTPPFENLARPRPTTMSAVSHSYLSPYTEFKSLADALCAVAHAQSVHKMKATYLQYYKSGSTNKFSKTNNVQDREYFQQKQKNAPLKALSTLKDIRMIFSADDDNSVSFSTVEDPAGGKAIPVRSVTTQTASEPDDDTEISNPGTASRKTMFDDTDDDLEGVSAKNESLTSKMASYLRNESSRGSSASSKYVPTAVQSVIVRNVPYNYYGDALITDNSVQLLQEKIVLATSRALSFKSTQDTNSNPSRKNKTAAKTALSAGKINSPHQNPTLNGMMQLLEELNEPFIPEGYELKGKHLEMASLAVKSLQELLNTDLFRSIQKEMPENNQNRAVTWAPPGPGVTKSIKASASSSVSSMGFSMKTVGNRKDIKLPKTFGPSTQKLYSVEKPGAPLVIKPSSKIRSNPKSKYDFEMRKKRLPVEEKTQVQKYAEKGLVGIEIDEYDPSATAFYRDNQGKYNSHGNRLKGPTRKVKDFKKMGQSEKQV